MATDLLRWFERNVDGFTFRGAGEKTGLHFTKIRRHLIDSVNASSVAETVVELCRAYDLDPLAGLVAAGIITPEEAGAETTLDDIPDSDLLKELLRRAEARG